MITAADFETRLCKAAFQRFNPAILTPGYKGFAGRFNAAQVEYAHSLEDLARETGNAALLAMAAEALMLPLAWAYHQVRCQCTAGCLPCSSGQNCLLPSACHACNEVCYVRHDC